MKTMIVDKYKNSELLSIYILEAKDGDFVESEQNITLAETLKFINKFKNKYGLTKATVVTFNRYGKELYRESVHI